MKTNRKTVADLRALKGQRQMTMLFVDTIDEIPSGANVLYSAHGVAPAIRGRA